MHVYLSTERAHDPNTKTHIQNLALPDLSVQAT